MNGGNDGSEPNGESREKPPRPEEDRQVDGDERKPGESTYRYYRRHLCQRLRSITHEQHLTYGTWALAIGTWALAALAYWALVEANRATTTQITTMQTANAQQHADTLAALKKTDAQIAASRQQTDIMRGQLDEMRATSDDTKKAIDATNRMAAAMLESVTEARRLADEAHRSAEAAISANALNKQLAAAAVQANQLQRAFITVKTPTFATLDKPPNNKSLWFAAVILQNNGNTPANNLSVRRICTSSFTRTDDPHTLPPIIKHDSPIDTKYGNILKYTLGPKETKQIGECPMIGYPPVPENAVAVRYHYSYGLIEYKDTLNQAGIHLTEFCFMAQELIAPSIPRLNSMEYWDGSVTTCANYNCIDDECGKDELRQAEEDLRTKGR